jgi:effector-binding domain-containing protein
MIFFQGKTTRESAFDDVVEGLKSVGAVRDKEGIKASGPALAIYSETESDNLNFQFKAGIPIAEQPKNPPKGGIAIGETPAGTFLKFVHRGSYDAIQDTYDKITDYMEAKDFVINGTLIEEFVTDPITTPQDQLVINIYVLFSDPAKK